MREPPSPGGAISRPSPGAEAGNEPGWRWGYFYTGPPSVPCLVSTLGAPADSALPASSDALRLRSRAALMLNTRGRQLPEAFSVEALMSPHTSASHHHVAPLPSITERASRVLAGADAVRCGGHVLGDTSGRRDGPWMPRGTCPLASSSRETHEIP